MNLRTLIEIIRPDIVYNYGDELDDLGQVDKTLVVKYEIVDEGLHADGDETHLVSLKAYHIIRNKDTNTHYRVSYTHDSWSDSTIETMQNWLSIDRVLPVEVKKYEYHKVVSEYLEDME